MVHRLTAAPPGPPHRPERVWYASYGSNTDRSRLRSYLAGGTAPGGRGVHPGCRDQSDPVRSVPVELPGILYFATESPVWTGGRAFYDPAADGRVRARAHLVTAQQFSDIAAQEMHRPPGHDLDLTRAIAEGRDTLGPGHYETLVRPGFLDGLPVLTFTAPWRADEVACTTPSGPYLRCIASGLLATGAWDAPTVARYLSAAPGASGAWTPDEIIRLTEPAPEP
ncbi:hypothetical protein GCM10010387_20020 [Streptomyces inusitatus]|uniref:Histone deacetylase n=1 Tax=Streptomyces inusitatus TaxID=68221 RepID=A0A918UQI0_9ACTN|nr:histone deacetylase [Streptomyces inusitatus]GGZ26687.1 hypothetical protein GCM10010387_20020 [Streptomyces inusitatus]